MKKLFAIVLALLMMVMLVACKFGSQDEADAGTQTTGQVETTEGTVPDEETTEPTEESSEATEEPTEESTEASEETNEEASEATEGATVDPDDVDISNAVESTSAEEPAKLGQWIKSTRYSAASGEYETIYWRVIGTTFDCQEDIDRYNSEDHLVEFTELENDDLSYCKVSYQVYFPEDFSAKEWGISSAELSLRAQSPDGGGIEWNGIAYIGLGSCQDISVEQEIMPGDVFNGEAIFVMIDDPSIVYVFDYYHNSLGAGDEVIHDYASPK